MDAITRLVTRCREAQARYEAAARAVGDPGLRLQFNHCAASRAGLLEDLGRAGGITVAPPDSEPPRPFQPPHRLNGRPVLGGEAVEQRLEADALRDLVRCLRDHDEEMLAECRRAREARDAVHTEAVLERLISVLSEDLERMRILESLTPGADDTAPHRSRA